MSSKPNVKDWIRWLGIGSSVAILLIVALVGRKEAGDYDDRIALIEGVLFVVIGFLPAFVAVFTSLARCLWPNLLIGLWFLFLGIILVVGHGGTSAMPLLLAALALSSTPILNTIFGEKMSTPYQPSEHERQGAPEAFKYELEMFSYAEEQLSNAQGDLRNAMIECALLHARNLLDFFTGNQPMMAKIDESSIRAGHFVEGNIWWKSSKLSHLQKRKKDINKALSHLTYDRIGAEYNWNDLSKFREEVEAAYSEFCQLLPCEAPAKWPRLKI